MSETDGGINILEIGSGNRPAIKRGGTLFDNPSVNYAAIDVSLGDSYLNQINYPFLIATIARLPFSDDSLDYIVMRSVLGQFTNSNFASAFQEVGGWGLYESFRTLRPGGQIIIAEENSPWQYDKVQARLESAGFENVIYEKSTEPYEQASPDSLYRTLRRPFYNDSPAVSGFSIWDGYPYIMLAQKPMEPEYIEIEADVYMDNTRRIPIFTVQSVHSKSDFEEQETAKKVNTTPIIYKKGNSNLRPPKRRR